MNNYPIPDSSKQWIDDSFEELYDCAPCGYVSTLMDGTLVNANHMFREWTGLSDQELGSCKFQNLLSIGSQVFYQTHFEPLIRVQGVIKEVVLEMVGKDKKILPVLVNSVRKASRNQEFGIVRTILFDMTERRRYERDLKAAKRRAEQQAALLEVLHDAISVMDLEGHFLFCNPAFQALYGWPIREIGSGLTLLENESITPVYRHALKEVLARGEWAGVLNLVSRGGQRINVCARWTLLRDESGAPSSVLRVESNREEARQFQTRANRRDRMQSLQRLTDGLAHHLNNILTPAAIYSEQLKRSFDPRAATLGSRIEHYVFRASNLIRQLLVCFHGVKGVLQSESAAFIVDDLLTRTDLASETISVKAHVPEHLPEVYCDRALISQALYLLCQNARNAMPTGGELHIRVDKVAVDEHQEGFLEKPQSGSYLCFQVQDSGVGFSEEAKEHMFEPFFTTREFGSGDGLGLVVCQGIAKTHHGFMDVESAPGQGSKVSLYLPLFGPSENPSSGCA